MIDGYSPSTQALLGSLFTWGVTALGAACVFLFREPNQKLLDASLGFAGGVMTAASFWSLLAPALEITRESGGYYFDERFAFFPVGLGFLAGAAFVYLADKSLPLLGIDHHYIVAVLNDRSLSINNNEEEADLRRRRKKQGILKEEDREYRRRYHKKEEFSSKAMINDDINKNNLLIRRTTAGKRAIEDDVEMEMEMVDESKMVQSEAEAEELTKARVLSWRRVFLLIIAVTVHNIPEGLAVGVGFGAVGKSSSATFESARNLALGIGIQNFPEGLAVSVPLIGFGYSKMTSFWYGQLSGMVEPVAAILGAAAVSFMEPLLPYALSFAAGAMIYVVVDDIVPEAQRSGNGKLASFGYVVGFLVMMSLDVGLG